MIRWLAPLALLGATAACAPTPAPQTQEAAISWASATRVEQDFAVALAVLEQALEAEKLDAGEILDAERYLDRAYLALRQARTSFDAGDAVEYERSLGILALNAERIKNLAVHGNEI